MKLSAMMNRFEPSENLPQYIGDDIVRYFLLVFGNESGQGPILHKLDEHEEGLSIDVGEEVLDNIIGLANFHDCDFLFNLL
jgi:hypothetical protein